MTLRLALVGAFPFPLAQGSQRFFADQGRALRDAGAEITAFTYGSGDGNAPADFELRRAPVWTSPRRLGSGFSARKPLADLALAQTLLAAHRERPFEAVLAHNAEAALAGFVARARGGPPVVYVAHTLWEHELESHLPWSGVARRWTSKHRRAGVGAALDRLCARQADAVVVLTEATRRALEPHTEGPIALIPPGWRAEPAPHAEEVHRACAKAGVEPERFAVYPGNLDRYQGLELLDAAAAALPELPCVAVTHARQLPTFRALRTVQVACPNDMRVLVFGAVSVAIPRRVVGGFPLKLIDAMDAKRAIVGHPAGLGGLRHAESAWCLPPAAGAAEWASSLASLQRDPALRARLGAGARAVLESEHTWPKLADRTLQLVAALR